MTEGVYFFTRILFQRVPKFRDKQESLSFSPELVRDRTKIMYTYGTDTYGTDTYGKDTYGMDTYGMDTYGMDTYGMDTYGMDTYGMDT